MTFSERVRNELAKYLLKIAGHLLEGDMTVAIAIKLLRSIGDQKTADRINLKEIRQQLVNRGIHGL